MALGSDTSVWWLFKHVLKYFVNVFWIKCTSSDILNICFDSWGYGILCDFYSSDTLGAVGLYVISTGIWFSFLENFDWLSRFALSELFVLSIFSFRSLALKPFSINLLLYFLTHFEVLLRLRKCVLTLFRMEGEGSKRSPYQFFPCNFCKHRKKPLKLYDF